MNKTLSLFAVLSAISLVSGLALGGLYEATYELAENNILKFKKIPAVVAIQELIGGALDEPQKLALEQELLAEKRLVDIGAKQPMLMFVVKKDDAPYAVALEDYGQGFGGKLGVMVGFTLAQGDLAGIGITTMSETPGLGTRVREPGFVEQFVDLPAQKEVKVKKDGGDIDAVSGATISSRAVAEAVSKAKAAFAEHKTSIDEAVAAGPAPKEKP